MIAPEFFINSLKKHGIDFFAGVPDSLLKNICAYISDHICQKNNIITANEGAAVGLAAGYHLATGNIPVVYMQNSGLGNAVNPFMSLIDKDVYKMPLLIFVGWRGEPGVHDEPQHLKQGKVTIPLLDAMGVKNIVMAKEENMFKEQLDEAVKYINDNNQPYAFVIQKGTFNDYIQQNNIIYDYPMIRETAIQKVVDSLQETDVVVSTTGMISRELFEYREAKRQGHAHDFLTVGSMGHASQIALGIAIEKANNRIFCFDGDGAVIMHMGSMAIIGNMHPKNYVHILFNNGAHDSVGGQPTVGLNINIPQIAKACGYEQVYSVTEEKDLISLMKKIKNEFGPTFIEIKVRKGSRKNLGRPTTSPIQNKENLMNFLK